MEMSLDHPLFRFLDHHLFTLILSALFFFLVVKACFYKRSSSKLRLPPGPKPLPVLGNIHQLAGAPIHVVLHNLAKKYGPVFHFKVGNVSFVSITSPEAAKEILKTQEHRFPQRPDVPLLEMTSFDQGSIFSSPSGEYWKQSRKICVMELLSPARVRHFRSLREQEISRLIESVKRTSGLPFNVSDMMTNCANSLISNASFGQKCKRQDEISSAVKEQLRLAGQFNVMQIFPSLRFLYHLDGTKAKMSRFRVVYNDVLESVIAERRIRAKSHDHSSSYDENLTDVLIRLKESSETRISLTDDTIKDILLDMLIGAIDTSPTAVEWALSEMLKNPNVMKKAQTELRDALKGKAILEEADLEKIQYLKLIIKETFRLHPSVSVLARLTREASIVHGYDIPKDSRVLINTWSLGRDPNHWENPEKFEPERFLSSSIDFVGTHFEFLPFGSGKRACPGTGFALASMELMLASLMYYFDWELADGVTPSELDMDEASGTMIKRLNPLVVVATPFHPTA